MDLTKFGYSCIAHLGIKVVPSKMDQAIKYVKTIKSVDFCAESIGSYNLIVFLFLTDFHELQKIIDFIRKEPSVLEVHTSIWSPIEKAIAWPRNINLKNVVGTEV